jgi:hypothetical protein
LLEFSLNFAKIRKFLLLFGKILHLSYSQALFATESAAAKATVVVAACIMGHVEN